MFTRKRTRAGSSNVCDGRTTVTCERMLKDKGRDFTKDLATGEAGVASHSPAAHARPHTDTQTHTDKEQRERETYTHTKAHTKAVEASHSPTTHAHTHNI